MLTSATCRIAPRPFVIDNDVLTLDKAYFLDTRAECGEVVVGPPLKWGRTTGEKPNHGHRGPLRQRRERPPRRRAAEQRDELAPANHSITSSAGAGSVSGTVRPSALAVLRLTTSSNLVGCSTGRSAGLAPLRILFTKAAARRNMSAGFGP